jgi:flavodoxin
MSSKKVLILYYSGSGNTKKMAKAIAEAMKSSAINVTVENAGKFDISSLLWATIERGPKVTGMVPCKLR